MAGGGGVIERVLIIGSGPIIIGQAAEFDYSGTQACLACREAGVHTILVNSNPATIQTDPHIADTVYIEPLRVETLTEIIAIERPEGLIATVGGQTALNLAVELDDAGVLQRYGVTVLGTDLHAIRRGEDRAVFATTLRLAGQPVLPSQAVGTLEEAGEAADRLGYPVMCRSGFALGGAGSGFARDPAELMKQVRAGLQSSGSGQVLIEKSVAGWAEIEYEVIRDRPGNCLMVCNMENIDPMGIHTGDSIVVAPSQTLSDGEYQVLRMAARQVVEALDVQGACNVQFALERQTGEYYVIEVNPRLSRSSALASKATGYPIAKVATRIALGQTLPEIRNDITGTSAFFEPALDYVTVKIPRWPFDKFPGIPDTIGTSMRSTGEVMAIGRTFEEAMSKALRSLDAPPAAADDEGDLIECLSRPNGRRLPAVLTALRAGWSIEQVAMLTGFHPWFVDRLAVVALAAPTDNPLVYKMVDTCAAEFEARTPYFYGSRLPEGQNETCPLAGPKAIILGSGPIRIGQGIEFDYATVHACRALSAAGVQSIVINNNPETVSTDYSISDRLYFEPLDLEAVAAVAEHEAEGLLGVIPQFGGQTAINLVQPLHERGIRLLGTAPGSIDDAEDRARASAILALTGIPAPNWQTIQHWIDLPGAVESIGYPALLRPSYVLSGRGMTVVRSRADLGIYLRDYGGVELSKPLLIDHFLEGATELNVDAVCDGRDIVTVVMEQLDECGIHSGDSAEVYPAQTVVPEVLMLVEQHTRDLAQAFGIIGLMNVQYAVHGDAVYVLEVNPRASRSVPFASKASGIPLAELAVRVILGQRLRDLNRPAARTDRVCVKNVVLPFRVFPALSPVLAPEMQSTGESMGIGGNFATAYWKAWLGAGLDRLPHGRSVHLAPADTSTWPAYSLVHKLLQQAGCTVSNGARASQDINLDGTALVIALGRSEEDLCLLRRAADQRVPAVSTEGGLRALSLALQEPKVCLAARRAW